MHVCVYLTLTARRQYQGYVLVAYHLSCETSCAFCQNHPWMPSWLREHPSTPSWLREHPSTPSWLREHPSTPPWLREYPDCRQRSGTPDCLRQRPETSVLLPLLCNHSDLCTNSAFLPQFGYMHTRSPIVSITTQKA